MMRVTTRRPFAPTSHSLVASTHPPPLHNELSATEELGLPLNVGKEDTVSKAQRFEEPGRVPVLAWMDDVEFDAGALQQLRNAANHLIVGPHVTPMPDAHRGNGRRLRRIVPALAAFLFTVAAVTPATAEKPAATPMPCLYGFEWLHTFRFPLQPDPHAAYSYVAPKPTADPPVGFLVDADFPYAAWFSWTIYGQEGLAVGLMSDHDVIPDAGSTNPFQIGSPVLAPHRHYRMLLLPPGVETVAPSLADIQNRLEPPTGTAGMALAYRVYQAFPGYLLGGSGGPTDTPFPPVYAVNFETGEYLDCTDAYNAIPASIGRLPTDTPDVSNLYGGSSKEPPGPQERELEHVKRLLKVPAFGSLQSKVGWQFAPLIDPTLVTFTRPPLAPGADVSSIPPPDQCSGYLGARVDPRRIALIRLPQVASFFDPVGIEPDTTYPNSDSAYISLTMYGASVNRYEPGDPGTASLADSEFLLDATGGSTIVVWPRDLRPTERKKVFAYARAQGWALLRGGLVGPITTANILFRLKGASTEYYGAYTPITDGRSGVPCYFNFIPPQPPPSWQLLEDAKNPMACVASFQYLGNAAPQGVLCADTDELLDGSCLARLKAYIAATGGSYYNPGNVPPPSMNDAASCSPASN